MYVCICNALTDQQIVTAAEMGARTVRDAYQVLGVEICCGQCTCMAKDLIDDVARPALLQAAE
ncbi:MAG: (2Fe-2S)-binding protein [Rhodospirillaceae bacterium]